MFTGASKIEEVIDVAKKIIATKSSAASVLHGYDPIAFNCLLYPSQGVLASHLDSAIGYRLLISIGDAVWSCPAQRYMFSALHVLTPFVELRRPRRTPTNTVQLILILICWSFDFSAQHFTFVVYVYLSRMNMRLNGEDVALWFAI